MTEVLIMTLATYLPIIEVGLALILSAYSGPRGTPKPRDYSLNCGIG